MSLLAYSTLIHSYIYTFANLINNTYKYHYNKVDEYSLYCVNNFSLVCCKWYFSMTTNIHAHGRGSKICLVNERSIYVFLDRIKHTKCKRRTYGPMPCALSGILNSKNTHIYPHTQHEEQIIIVTTFMHYMYMRDIKNK